MTPARTGSSSQDRITSAAMSAATRTRSHARLHARVQSLLSDTQKRLQVGDVAPAMQALLEGLTSTRRIAGRDHWPDIACSVHAHPALRWIHEAPLTRRAFQKPRGYAGDAVTLDYIYGAIDLPPDTTPLGREIYDWEFQTVSCRAVRARRDLFAERIDSVARERTGARVLSVACGYLREAKLCRSISEGGLGAFYALDHDPESLAVVDGELQNSVVHAVCETVGGLLKGRTTFHDLDLAYAAGLYDYLSDGVAAALTQVLFRMLSPGGRLIIANFTEDLPDTGYLEGCMDWRLIYRDEANLGRLLWSIDPSEMGTTRFFPDETRLIVFIEVERS